MADLQQSRLNLLRIAAIAAGFAVATLFILVGVTFRLQMYGDGSIFSYAVAIHDAWAFHWHNIAARSTVYFVAMAPAEAYVRLTGDPYGAIFIYGLLFFSAQLAGLLITYAADRSKGRVIFTYACFSTACLCPLVFGAPTEMWFAHALFWPVLALAHYARRNVAGTLLLFGLMLALVFSHEGALIYATVILMTLFLRGTHDFAFRRGLAAVAVALAVWIFVKLTIHPDSYIASALSRAAFDVFGINVFIGNLMLLLYAALILYLVSFAVIARFEGTRPHFFAAAFVTLMLAAYWLGFDHSVHAENRYYLRTIVLLGAPVFALLAASYVIIAEGRLAYPQPLRKYLIAARDSRIVLQLITGAFSLLLLIHAVETAKFVSAWAQYKTAITKLATGSGADPSLGDPRFVSAARVPERLQPLGWFSTTPYLSVLLAPNLTPQRLVVDPIGNYFWLSCAAATESAEGRPYFPAAPREMIRVYSCLHRN
jgi:hypothetical protein